MSGKTVARVIIAVLAGIALGGIIVLVSRPRVDLPPLPPPPAIAAERGNPPSGIVAFEERVQASGNHLIGSGFLLELPHGDVIGVTTAHSLGEGNFSPIVFTAAGHAVPVVTFVGWWGGRLLGGIVIMEIIFAVPGMGTALVQAVSNRDYPTVQAIVFVMALIFLILNLLVDLVYGWLDPRIRYA